jgi:hypothetical protein
MKKHTYFLEVLQVSLNQNIAKKVSSQILGLKDLNNNNREWKLTEKHLLTSPSTPDGVEQ